MNVTTGKIYTKEELKKLGLDKLLFNKDSDYIPIDPVNLTEKQSKEMQVSKNDNRSKIGKTWTELRKEKKARQKEIKNNI